MVLALYYTGMKQQSMIRCDPVDEPELGEDMTALLELANENGIPREDIVDVLERHVNHLESERGKERFDGYEELHY